MLRAGAGLPALLALASAGCGASDRLRVLRAELGGGAAGRREVARGLRDLARLGRQSDEACSAAQLRQLSCPSRPGR